jgi:hypothetical protein
MPSSARCTFTLPGDEILLGSVVKTGCGFRSGRGLPRIASMEIAFSFSVSLWLGGENEFFIL